jgi:hypothetical protein
MPRGIAQLLIGGSIALVGSGCGSGHRTLTDVERELRTLSPGNVVLRGNDCAGSSDKTGKLGPCRIEILREEIRRLCKTAPPREQEQAACRFYGVGPAPKIGG